MLLNNLMHVGHIPNVSSLRTVENSDTSVHCAALKHVMMDFTGEGRACIPVGLTKT